jgi:hypothetical protein
LLLPWFFRKSTGHYIENVRVKEFSKSLVQDLQYDTAAINVQRNYGTYTALSDPANLSKMRLKDVLLDFLSPVVLDSSYFVEPGHF